MTRRMRSTLHTPLRLALVAMSLVMTACLTSAVSYSPSPTLSEEEAVGVVAEALDRQHPDFVPIEASVNSEKIEVVHIRTRQAYRGEVTTVPERTVVHFKAVERTDIVERMDWYYVRMWEEEDVMRLQILCSTQDGAFRLADAITSLAQAARSN